jgi:iron-sulfur cluster assembly protein
MIEAETSTETKTEPTIHLSPAAVKAVKGIIAKKNLGAAALRLGVEGGGCSGLSYQLNFDTEITTQDKRYEFDGLRVLVDEKSATYLNGITLDFSEALVGGGFKFINPNAKQSCGCGESFST